MEKRILIVEDEIIVALDIQEILEAFGFTCFACHRYADAMRVLMEQKPNLLICDINLGSAKTGIDFVREAKVIFPQLAVIYVSAFSDKQVAEEAASTGPINYLVKPWNENQLRISVDMAFEQISRSHKAAPAALPDFTPMEKKILTYIGEEKKTKEIADLLFISEKTVKNHRYNMTKKLQLPNENNSLLLWVLRNLLKNEA